MNRKIVGLMDLHGVPSLGALTSRRSIASVSFLGRYAIMDFNLSNMANSDIDYMGILAQEKLRSLGKHLGNGNAWLSNTKTGKVQFLYDEPYASTPGYNTDIHNILENWWFVEESGADYVLLVPPHIIHRLDYRELLDYHIAMGSRCTLVYARIGNGLDHMSGSVVDVDGNGNVTAIRKNDGSQTEGLENMEIYLMDKSFLVSCLNMAQKISSFFSLQDLLSYNAGIMGIKAFEYKGNYLRCIDSLSHYFAYSLEVLSPDVANRLFDPAWPLYTKSYDTPPAYFSKESEVSDSYVANGATIFGTVRHSILSRDVVVEKGAVVENAIVLSGAHIFPGSVIKNVVLDKEAKVVHKPLVEGSNAFPVYINRGDQI